MKRITYISLIMTAISAFLFHGCITYRTLYVTSLKDVAINNINMPKTHIVEGKTYSDDKITIEIECKYDCFTLIASNNTNKGISIFWDGASVITPADLSSPIIRGSTKGIQVGISQVSTVIPPQSRIVEAFIATNQYPLSSVVSKSKERLIAAGLKYVGKSFKVYLPIQIEGEIIYYLFDLGIDLIKPI